MAITILQQPTDYTPAGNFIVFIVGSDNTTEPNFKYVANVSINGNMIAKLKAFPNPSNSDRAVFNVQELVRNFFDVTPVIADGIVVAGAFACDSQIASLQVEFVEEYTGAPANSEESNVITLWNGAFDVMEFAQWPNVYFNQYQIIPSSPELSVLPLTNRPQSTKAISTASYKQSGNIYFLNNISSEANYDYVIYTYYGSDNSPYRVFTIKTPNWVFHNSSPAELNESQMIGTPFMPFDVFNIPSSITSDGDAGSESFPEFSSYYSVAGSKNGGQKTSIEYFVYLNEDCSRFEPTEIHFENQLGAVDSYAFTKTNREIQTIERVQASKPYLNFNETNTFTQYGTPTNYSRFNAQVDFTRQYTALSDWLTDAEFQWLQELVRSPRVWLRKAFQTDEGVREYLVPILITDTSYNVYKRDIDQLKTLSVTYRFTFDEAKPL
jgi:hypothetical protein